MNSSSFTTLVVGLVFASAAGAQTPAVPDLVLRNGHIFTGDKANPWVEAISIRGERIVMAASDAAVIATAGPQTKVIDLHGRMAMPGINDSHDHVGNEVKRGLADESGVEPSIKAFHAYAQQRLAQGVTTVQVMATNQRLSYLEKTFAQPDDPLRIRIMRFPMALEDARIGEKLGTGEEILSPRVRVAGVKYVLDGTPIEELAYQTKDYADKPGWRGRSDYSVGSSTGSSSWHSTEKIS